jgi:hypothetical protein
MPERPDQQFSGTSLAQIRLAPHFARAFLRTLRYPSVMDILKMLSDLRQEREQIGEAIIALERLAQGHGKRRGRPPAWMSAQKNAPKRRGRPLGSKNKN